MESDLKSVATRINFKSFTTLLEKITKVDETPQTSRSLGKNEEKKRLIQKFIEFWRHTSKDENQKLNDNFYPVMRLLLPHDDDRVYGLKETKLAKYLIEALCIAPKSDDAQKLLNYRSPGNIKSDGDFASVAYFILKNRCREDLTLNLDEINHHLNLIALNNSRGKDGQKEVNKSIKHLLLNLSAVQLKWLIRIILKDLKIGIKETVILDSFHPDAMDVYNFTSSIERVCSLLNNPNKRFNEVGIEIFSPCRPMLGEKAKPNKIEELMSGREFLIETKFDGERFQMHKNGNKFKYFSRNSHEYTETFGEDNLDGTLTPYIYNSFSSEVKSVILDGEMCSYNTKEKILLSKGDDIDVKSTRQYENIQTCYCVFDVLMYNDIVLTNRPLKERIEFIRKCFSEIEGRIQYSVQQKARSNQHVVDALNNAIDCRLEGIVVKDPESVYKPSQRGGGWYKVKPDYMIGLNDDLDLIVLGGYHGTGKRSGLVSHFLLGLALDEPKIESDDLILDSDSSNPKKFYSLCKIGSGYTHKELLDYNDKLKDKWKKFDKKCPPFHLELGYEKPDLWIEPKDSFIVQVKAVEINSSDKYKTGFTLRFPRLEKFRPDKNWYECMKVSEFEELKDKNCGKLSNRHLDLDELDNGGGDDGPSPRKKRMVRRIQKATVGNLYRGVDPSVVDKISEIFDGKEICVLIEDDSKRKNEYEKSIIELGGEIVQNPGRNTFCILTTRSTHRVKSYIKNGAYDIVKIDWLDKCINDKKFNNFKPSDMVFSKSETKDKFRNEYDSFGDSYVENVTIESLKQILNTGNFVKPEFKLVMDFDFKLSLRQKIAEFENTYFPDTSKYGLFRMCTFYFDFYDEIQDDCDKQKDSNSSLDLVELKTRWYGGMVLKNINEKVTHCVLDKNSLNRLNRIKELNKKRNRKFRTVSKEWILDSITNGRLKDELAYAL